jgi:hypothetical protein
MGTAVIATPSNITLTIKMRIILSNMADLPFLFVSCLAQYTYRACRERVRMPCQNSQFDLDPLFKRLQSAEPLSFKGRRGLDGQETIHSSQADAPSQQGA